MRLEPRTAVFVILSFEGPDEYSQAGGLGVRVKGLSRALARLGYDTYLYFVGDPRLPAAEELEDGRLHFRRWAQWISSRHPGGVYDGEEGKLSDWNVSLPVSLIEDVIGPAVAAGKNVIVIGEEWHTAWSMKLISDTLFYRGLRDRVVMLWNANNLFGFHRIDWGSLSFATSITTVSRYMKFKMWDWGQNPMVVPNGIPRDSIRAGDPEADAALREAAGAEHFWFKIGRFDPDKRWLMAMSAAAYLKRAGSKVKLIVRGGKEAHGEEAMTHARNHGLVVRSVRSPDDAGGLAALLRDSEGVDVLNLTTFVPDALVASLYSACDAVLANSGHEPFGLVGLEVMAAGGLAVTGSTGEDYAEPYRNALVLETDDPIEIVSELTALKERPRLVASIRKRGHTTARDYTWEKVIGQLLLRIDFAAARQGVAAGEPEASPRTVARAPRKGAAGRLSKLDGLAK